MQMHKSAARGRAAAAGAREEGRQPIVLMIALLSATGADALKLEMKLWWVR
jgi:hypothetical protein